jgi:hypothetical protein
MLSTAIRTSWPLNPPCKPQHYLNLSERTACPAQARADVSQNLVQVNVGKLASSAITGVATRQANAMVAKQRNTVQQHITASPRGYEVKQAADFVRIRELFTSGTTSEPGHFQTWAREVARSALPLRTDVAAGPVRSEKCQIRTSNKTNA